MASKVKNDDYLLDTSQFTKTQQASRSKELLAIIIIAVISIALGAVNVAIFSLTSLRTTPTCTNIYPSSTDPTILKVWAAAGIAAVFGFIYGILGRSYVDAKSKQALAFLIFGPFAVLLSLAQAIGATLMAICYISTNIPTTINDLNTNFGFALLDIVVSIFGLMLVLLILYAWIETLRKKQKPKPTETPAAPTTKPATPAPDATTNSQQQQQPNDQTNNQQPRQQQNNNDADGPTTIYIPVPYPVPAPALGTQQQQPAPTPFAQYQPQSQQQPPSPQQLPQIIVISQPPPPPAAVTVVPPRPPPMFPPPTQPMYLPPQQPQMFPTQNPYSSPFAGGFPAMRRNPYSGYQRPFY